MLYVERLRHPLVSPARRRRMELSLDSTDKELVLDLLRTLRGTAAAAPAAPRAAADDRAGRAKEALADERAARKKALANAALLKQETARVRVTAWIHRVAAWITYRSLCYIAAQAGAGCRERHELDSRRQGRRCRRRRRAARHEREACAVLRREACRAEDGRTPSLCGRG